MSWTHYRTKARPERNNRAVIIDNCPFFMPYIILVLAFANGHTTRKEAWS